jgi:hypothetical protein
MSPEWCHRLAGRGFVQHVFLGRSGSLRVDESEGLIPPGGANEADADTPSADFNARQSQRHGSVHVEIVTLSPRAL